MYKLKDFVCLDCGHEFEELVCSDDIVVCPQCEIGLVAIKEIASNWNQGRHSSVKCYDTEPIGGDEGH